MTNAPLTPEPTTPGRRLRLRGLLDKAFTLLAGGAVLAIALALLVVLAPMLWRGASAVVFPGTVEFRRMQLSQFNRGDRVSVAIELGEVAEARKPVYALLDRFKRGIATDDLKEDARRLYREFGKQLDGRDTAAAERAELRSLAKRLRDDFTEALETPDKAAAQAALGRVLQNAEDARLKGTVAEGFFAMARDYGRIVETVDLGHRAEYAKALAEVQESIRGLFGLPPNAERPPLVMDQYGATRWDAARKHLDRLLMAETWTAERPGEALQRVQTPREEQFAGTDLAPLFPLVRDHITEMLQPRWTFYWQYFIDDSLSGHYFGGVGPEVLGTLLITVLAILFAFPLGVIAAAYLVECASDSRTVQLIRTCINTLAGVPSIVFGLFGLAFFVVFLLPLFGLPQGSSVLAGGLTLGLLVLPIIIRASEEAIRSVPQTYKEAALALGAGRLRCFVTVTLPAALPGILTGAILSVSRAAGETAPILFTAAVAMGSTSWPPWSALAKPTQTLAYSSYHLAVGDRLASLVPHNQYGMVMTLILLVLAMNIAAIVVRSRMARRLRGQ
jgi:phosphate transport system permease protein